MIETKEVSNGVFYAQGPLISVGDEEIAYLKEKLSVAERHRTRLCTHKDTADELHEMLIVLSRRTYIRPHKHLTKAESLHVIQGEADAVFFDDSGKIEALVPLGNYSSGRQFYYRISRPIYHTLLIRSESFIFHETARGPFKREDTVFAPWSPEDGDAVAAARYSERLFEIASHFGSGGVK